MNDVEKYEWLNAIYPSKVKSLEERINFRIHCHIARFEAGYFIDEKPELNDRMPVWKAGAKVIALAEVEETIENFRESQRMKYLRALYDSHLRKLAVEYLYAQLFGTTREESVALPEGFEGDD